MNKVDIINGYSYQGYTIYKVKPAGYINFGRRADFFAFDYENLADNWCISKQLLDTLASYDLKFGQGMHEHIKETKSGPERITLISTDVVPDLLLKLRDSGKAEVLDIAGELQVINKMIHVVVDL
ncbi:hypothetical protein [Paenibacillus cymbidii]|uniref:hypothetical protein n=1 Tax=Paenibacillus cymbidii TaxID=1639034 RepID=UPI0010804D9A|nr:hypothetical protein [Paenibacillus cymbidii]